MTITPMLLPPPQNLLLFKFWEIEAQHSSRLSLLLGILVFEIVISDVQSRMTAQTRLKRKYCCQRVNIRFLRTTHYICRCHCQWKSCCYLFYYFINWDSLAWITEKSCIMKDIFWRSHKQKCLTVVIYGYTTPFSLASSTVLIGRCDESLSNNNKPGVRF